MASVEPQQQQQQQLVTGNVTVGAMKYSNNKVLPKGFDTQLQVDNIIDSKVSKDQKRHYLVCFKTWLAEEQLNNELIDQFWRKRQEDTKPWTGSLDGESDKENNFLSPTSSKTKRSYIFPSTDSQTTTTTTTSTTTTDNNTIETDKYPDIRSNGTPITDTTSITEGPSELYDEETYDLRIDESATHSPPPTQVDDDGKETTTFVERLHDGVSPSSQGDGPFEHGAGERHIPTMYPTMEHPSMEYLHPTNSDSPVHHRGSLYHLSRNQELCVDGTPKHEDDVDVDEEETPIVTMQDNDEEMGPPPTHDRKLVNGERRVEEFGETTYDDGRLSMYDDEPVDGSRGYVEYEETEEAEESDVSDFGAEEPHTRNLGEDRNSSSPYSDVTPEGMELNKFTPLNTVQMKEGFPMEGGEEQTHVFGGAVNGDGGRSHPMEEDEEEEMGIGNTASESFDGHSGGTPVEESKAAGAPDRLSKKRKGKTLDDIVRKISSANEHNHSVDGGVTGPQEMGVEEGAQGDMMVKQEMQEVMQRDAMPETTHLPANEGEKHYHLPNGTTTTTNNNNSRENNVYWSAGKAFQKRNVSYKCKYCEHRFDDEVLLNEHERTHGQHQCRNCNETFLTSQKLFEHRETAHAFKPRQRYNKCRFCPTLYADPAMLQRHEEIHHLSRSPVTHVHPEERGMGDLPPPLMTIDESQRKFPQYEKHRDGMPTSRSPRDMERKGEELKGYEGEAVVEDEEGKSIVRNPIRNLLGKMYQTQKKMEHGGQGDRFPPRFTAGYRPRVPHPPGGHQQFHYTEYPQHRYAPPPPSNPSPDHPPREYRPEHRDSMPDDDLRDLVHICRLCNKTFGVKESLEQHWMTSHQDTPTFSCEVCQEMFIDREDLSAHMNIHLKKDFYCGYCRKSFDCRQNYETHMRAHSNDRPFRCHICGRAFSLRTNLRRHILIHTDITPYRCHICFKGFRRSDMLSSHIKQYHADVKDADKIPRTSEANPDAAPYAGGERPGEGTVGQDSVSPVFQPPPSGRSSPYTSSHEMNGHSDTSYSATSPSQASDEHKVYKSPDSSAMKHSPTTGRMHHSPGVPRSEGDVGMPPHAAGHPPPPAGHHVVALHQMPPNPTPEHFIHRPPNGMLAPGMGGERPPHRLIAPIPLMKQARFSPYKTNLVNILPLPVQQQQQQQQRGGAGMECTECGEKFTSESLYDIHMQSHVKEASYTCRKCRRTFSGKSQYNSHMQTHENNKSHSCPYCHRSFSMKGNLRRHIRIHTNEAPYECPICFQRFRRSDGLKGHIKRHDAMGESAPVDMVPSQASSQQQQQQVSQAKIETSF